MATISRAAMALEFPCSFLLVCAMNPCPCGYRGDPGRRCRCSPHDVQRYRSRISGPLLDRIDLQIDVPVAPFDRLVEARRGEPSETLRGWVQAARAHARILKVARTIADLADSAEITAAHISEAIQYRKLDRGV